MSDYIFYFNWIILVSVIIFNNNLIDFSRAQSNYKLKIDNFFNTESNSNIIKITNLIKEFIDYISKLSNGKNKDNKNKKTKKNRNSKYFNNIMKII